MNDFFKTLFFKDNVLWFFVVVPFRFVKTRTKPSLTQAKLS